MGDNNNKKTPPPKPELNGPRKVQESLDPLRLIKKTGDIKKGSK